VLFGIIDFGDLFMKEHLITNASREGARYGVAYRVDSSNNRILPSSQTTQIKSVVNNYLTGSLPTGTWTVPNPTYDTTTRKLTVTVNATKSWLGPLGLCFGDPFSFSATTVMIAE
jgi:Flp pilus assembly protein TadG